MDLFGIGTSNDNCIQKMERVEAILSFLINDGIFATSESGHAETNWSEMHGRLDQTGLLLMMAQENAEAAIADAHKTERLLLQEAAAKKDQNRPE